MLSATKREVIYATGLSIEAWARQHGFSGPLVRAVLDGKIEGRYGQSFRIVGALRRLEEQQKEGGEKHATAMTP